MSRLKSSNQMLETTGRNHHTERGLGKALNGILDIVHLCPVFPGCWWVWSSVEIVFFF